ncbi:hypothetical protein B0H13DRAFT_2290513 [Mycena leptocephala]|nr:hypothetical protein B0H13DRAFT_2290513 [Mycena leptocephala]
MVKTTVTTVVRPLVRIPTNTKDFTMHIKFYEGDHNAKGNKPYAEFVAEISTAEVGSLGLDGFDGKGTWKDGLGATAADTLLGPQTLTFTEILGKTYRYNVPASALVINNPFTKALRLEVPELGKEFSDGAWIGKDPQGILYYNDLNDFKVKQSSYHITAVTVTVQDGTKSTTTKFMRIKFFVKSEDDCYAEFVANDPAGVAANLGDGGLTKKGDWKDLDIGCATAAISKPAGTAEITVTANSIHKKATIKCNSMDDATLIAQVIDVKGNLYFKDTSQIDTGVFANWNNDRVVFYSDNMYAKDFTAYFIRKCTFAHSLLKRTNSHNPSLRELHGGTWCSSG